MSFSGSVAGALGDYAEARKFYQESLAILREIGDSRQIAITLNNLGYASRILGHTAEAKAFLEEGLAIALEIDFRRVWAYALSNLGRVAHLLGDYPEAQRRCQESLSLARDIGDRNLMVYVLGTLGEAADALEDYAAAGERFREAFKMASEMRALPRIIASLAGLTALLAKQKPMARERAVELLVRLLQHPAMEYEVKVGVERALDELRLGLPAAAEILAVKLPEDLAAALEA